MIKRASKIWLRRYRQLHSQTYNYYYEIPNSPRLVSDDCKTSVIRTENSAPHTKQGKTSRQLAFFPKNFERWEKKESKIDGELRRILSIATEMVFPGERKPFPFHFDFAVRVSRADSQLTWTRAGNGSDPR